MKIKFYLFLGIVMLGGGVGGIQGLYKGLQETNAAGHSVKIRRTQ